jgi:hypothetical protein
MNLYRLYHQVLDYAGDLAPQQWIVILAVIILIGAFFLRGFGSRAKY